MEHSSTYVAVPMKITSNLASVMKVMIPAKRTKKPDAVSAIKPRAIGTRNNRYTGIRRIATTTHTENTLMIFDDLDAE